MPSRVGLLHELATVWLGRLGGGRLLTHPRRPTWGMCTPPLKAPPKGRPPRRDRERAGIGATHGRHHALSEPYEAPVPGSSPDRSCGTREHPLRPSSGDRSVQGSACGTNRPKCQGRWRSRASRTHGRRVGLRGLSGASGVCQANARSPGGAATAPLSHSNVSSGVAWTVSRSPAAWVVSPGLGPGCQGHACGPEPTTRAPRCAIGRCRQGWHTPGDHPATVDDTWWYLLPHEEGAVDVRA